jgi:myo-inositol 2-dehydrogenase/D-chiro-inositol 1-dehydrogenase
MGLLPDYINSRKNFLKNSLKASLAFTIIPRFVMGGNGYTAPSDKITLGFYQNR